MSLVALDLFAGTGWGVACRILGIEEHGVELMPEARATREANGMHNLYADVWHGLEHALDVPAYDLLIASPPCQTFSMAGGGAGRRALDEVLALIDSRAYLDVAKLRAFGEAHDMRTALVLTPLAHIARDAPLYVVLEQVPQVLPVWERYAVELRKWGYSVVTGVLNAEQYGVPQTRKRAILIARADGIEARMPTPTHSRYYPSNKTKLDPGVEPWVPMAVALNWGMTARPYFTLAGGGPNGSGHTGAQDPAMVGGTGARRALHGERESGRWVEGSPFNEGAPIKMLSNNKLPHSAARSAAEPAATITAGHDSSNRVWITDEALVGDEWCVDCHDRVDIHDEGGFCAGLCGGNCQSPEFGRPGVWNTDDGLPPEGWVPEPGARYFHPMTYGRRGIHPGDEPAPTIRGVQRGMPETYEPHPNDAVVFQGHQKPDSKRTSGEPDAYQTRGAALPAPSITSGSRSAQWLGRFNDQSGTDFDPEWPDKRPALTVATRDIVPNPRHNKSRHDEATKSRNDGVRVTVREAARLQTYPDTFDWSPMVSVLRSGVDTGKLAPMSKTKAFLQIGNAVPPLLALRTLSVILDDMALTPERLERKATP